MKHLEEETPVIRFLVININCVVREYVSTGAACPKTHRFLGHHLLHPKILRHRALFDRTDCIRRFKFLMHALLVLIYLQCRYLAYLITMSRSIEKKVLNTNYLANVATSGLEKLFPRSSLA